MVAIQGAFATIAKRGGQFGASADTLRPVQGRQGQVHQMPPGPSQGTSALQGKRQVRQGQHAGRKAGLRKELSPSSSSLGRVTSTRVFSDLIQGWCSSFS